MGICSFGFQQRIFFSEVERGLNPALDSPIKGSDGSDGDSATKRGLGNAAMRVFEAVDRVFAVKSLQA
jgi:hypothetical protein